MAVKYLLLLAFVVGASAQLNNQVQLQQLQQLHATGFDGVCVVDCASALCYTYLSACPAYQQALYYQDACSALNRLPAIVMPPQTCSYLNYVRQEGAILKVGGVQCLCRNGDFVQCTPVQSNTVVEVLVDDPEVSIFVSLLAMPEYANVTALLNDTEATLTVFVPNDDAFLALLNATGLDPVADAAAIIGVLQYHVSVLGGFSSRILSAAEGLEMANTEIVTFTRELQRNVLGGLFYGPLMVDNSTVVTADIIASNGLIHVIDQVLIPDTIPGPPDTGNTLYDIVSNNEQFQLFAAVVDLPAYSDIKDFLMSADTTGTVFVPDNLALLTFLQQENLNPENPADVPVITIFLNYHLLTLKLPDSGEYQYQIPTRAQNGNVALTVDVIRSAIQGIFTVNNVNIVGEVVASNGVVYALQTILILPPLNPIPPVVMG